MARGCRRAVRTAPGLVLALAAAACLRYDPTPLAEVPFLARAQTREEGGVRVSVAVPDAKESERVFGVPLARKDVQPVWVQVDNASDVPWLLLKRTVDPSYYSPAEAARLARYRSVSISSLAVLPLLPVAVVQRWQARAANERMADRFHELRFTPDIIPPGESASGFVFTTEDRGTKRVEVALFGPDQTRRFEFFVPVPGTRLDHEDLDVGGLYPSEALVSCGEEDLRRALEALPCCTTRQDGGGQGDPLNLVVAGDFDQVLQAFRHAGWDETERLSAGSAWHTAKATLSGSYYRTSPMSSLYLFGRKQDVGFQKVRTSIHERHHFRLWATPLRYGGKPVWVGAASRDIGVYFTPKAWNLMTHAIDPDVDDARDYVLTDVLEAERVGELGFVAGVGAASPSAPRRNLMGAPWHTDGLRAVMALDDRRERPRILDWEWTLGDAAAVAADDGEASGRVTLTVRSLAAGIGVSAGSGTLFFRGQRYPFRVRGVVLGGLSVAADSAEGSVHGLARAGDFAGRYVAVQAGAAVGAGGGGVLARNDKGVVLRLRATVRGVQVHLGPGGVEVELEAPPRASRGAAAAPR
jgi:hypothetical protein